MKSRLNILYLVHRFPYPPNKGDRIRAFHTLRFLRERANVHLACLADEPVTQETIDELQGYCERLAVVPIGCLARYLKAGCSLISGRPITEGAFRSRVLQQTIQDWSQATAFQAIVVSASSMIPYLQQKPLQGIPAVVDLVDVDSQKWLDYAQNTPWPWSWLYRTEGKRLRKLEQQLPPWTQAVTLVSEAEANIYRQISNRDIVHAVTNGVDLQYFHNVNEDALVEEACVFVGAMDYYPNVDAAVWFCREVWPDVRYHHPDAKFYLVGRNPVPAVTRLGEVPGVEVVGSVPDVRPYLARAAVSVNPLRIARGLQNKVLEALAMSKAVIASPAALAALRTEPEIHLLKASSAQEWGQAISRLFQDQNLRQQLGKAGRQYVEENHDWDSCLSPLGDLLWGSESHGDSYPSQQAENVDPLQV